MYVNNNSGGRDRGRPAQEVPSMASGPVARELDLYRLGERRRHDAGRGAGPRDRPRAHRVLLAATKSAGKATRS